MAIYQGTALDFWNIWGLDNLGKITSDGNKFFYLKDHLGSIRATVDQNNNLVSSQDYDSWGYPMENRSWQSRSYTINNMYKFTSKERDNESNYDYFGARYYDSKIGRWGGVEPLLDKYVSWSPYSYSLNNPINSNDINGLQVKIEGYNTKNTWDIYNYIKDYADFGTTMDNDGNISLKKELSRSEYLDLDEDQRALYNAINEKDHLITLKGTEEPKISEGLFVGGAESTMDVHYVHLPSAEILQGLNIYDVQQLILHEVIEMWLQVSENRSFGEAHDQAVTWFPWGRTMKTLGLNSLAILPEYSNNKISAFWDIPTKGRLYFYSYNPNTRAFQWLDVLNQLEKMGVIEK